MKEKKVFSILFVNERNGSYTIKSCVSLSQSSVKVNL
jgi:hypothetical protein